MLCTQHNIHTSKYDGTLQRLSFLKLKKRKVGPKILMHAMFIGYDKNIATYKFLVVKYDNNLVKVNTIVKKC